MCYKLEDFRMDLRKTLTPENGIWVTSGYSTCMPEMGTVMGVKGCFSPPFAAPDLSLAVHITANGRDVPDTGSRGKNDCGLLYSGGEWYPDRIVRRGTYHWQSDLNRLSFAVKSELIPLMDAAGFGVKITVKNREPEELYISIAPLLHSGHPGVMPLSDWGFMPPPPFEEEAVGLGGELWENGQVRVSLLCEGTQVLASEGQTAEFLIAVILTNKGVSHTWNGITSQLSKTRNRWLHLLNLASEKLPHIKSDIPGLENYWNRSILSGLVCLWENESFITNPFPACSGIDGGSVCCYPWDVAGYSAKTLVMLLGNQTLDFLKAMLHSGIDRHISMAADGTGLGWCSYSYSMWSLIHLYSTILTYCDKGWELFDEILAIFQKEEDRLPEWEDLKDYGKQHNLLEMRTSGYEHFVPSPNAERAWCYKRLAEIGEKLGRDVTSWHEKAERIRQSICCNLWDENNEWFQCRYPDGHCELVYSIQIFDVLKCGGCEERMKPALFQHIEEGKFLGQYGVSSISAEDTVHYELNDTDWSGGGCYTGDGPELAETLWKENCADLAWDVLRRHFWMGEHLLYYPQEHDCDVPRVPSHKRSNIIAGVSGMQAILFGMAGIRPAMDGSIEIMPHPPESGKIKINGFRFRDRSIDLELQPDLVKIAENGITVYEGAPKQITI